MSYTPEFVQQFQECVMQFKQIDLHDSATSLLCDYLLYKRGTGVYFIDENMHLQSLWNGLNKSDVERAWKIGITDDWTNNYQTNMVLHANLPGLIDQLWELPTRPATPRLVRGFMTEIRLTGFETEWYLCVGTGDIVEDRCQRSVDNILYRGGSIVFPLSILGKTDTFDLKQALAFSRQLYGSFAEYGYRENHFNSQITHIWYGNRFFENGYQRPVYYGENFV